MSETTGNDATERLPPAVDRRMLDLLVCPLTRTRLRWDAAAQELLSPAARLAYPVRDGVPILVAGEAREMDDEEVDVAKRM